MSVCSRENSSHEQVAAASADGHMRKKSMTRDEALSRLKLPSDATPEVIEDALAKYEQEVRLKHRERDQDIPVKYDASSAPRVLSSLPHMQGSSVDLPQAPCMQV